MISSVFAQTTLNPDISAVGEMFTFTHDDENRPNEKEKLNLSSPELELVVGGYLNPYARADAVIAWHEGTNAEIEEFYATILRGLPLNLNLRAGKYLLEFGRLNPVHPHAWSFSKRPLVHEHFFSEEGINDVAIRASFLLPTGNAYTELMAAVLKGDVLAGHHHEEVVSDEHESEPVHPGFFGRITSSLAVSDGAELALGTSVINSVFDAEEPEALRAWLVGLDAKYKYKPSSYSTLLIEAEGITRIDDQPDTDDKIKSHGFYGYVDYRFAKKYNLGAIFEWAKHKSLVEDTLLGDFVEEEETNRYGLFAGFAPIEETTLVRLIGHWTEPKNEDGFWELGLQFVFSLGPHKAHNF
jgi:hypothetical protein